MRPTPIRTVLAACGALGLLAAASIGTAAAAQDTATGAAAPAAAKTPARSADELTKAGFRFVRMKTNKGEVHILLDSEGAPRSVDNFLKYVDDEYYDGTVFHRVIPTFMIQGGGFTTEMRKKDTRPGIRNEWLNGLRNLRGSLAMARLGGKPDSGTSQFFINVEDNWFLDHARDGAAYAVFGTVVDGMDVVDAIRSVRTGNGMVDNRPAGDVPQEPVVIESIRRLPAGELSPAARGVATTWLTTWADARAKWNEIQDDADALAAESARRAQQAQAEQIEKRREQQEAQRKAQEEAARRLAELEESMKERLERARTALDERGEATDSGLVTAVITEGEGPTAPAGTTVTIHYTGWLVDGGKMFDSSESRGAPATFPLPNLIKGWQEGVPLMKKGETRVMRIPPELGYGARDAPGAIPPNATLIFEITLIDF